jgi:hypothetical protein
LPSGRGAAVGGILRWPDLSSRRAGWFCAWCEETPAGEHAGLDARGIRSVADQDVIGRKARGMAKKTEDGDWMTVEFPGGGSAAPAPAAAVAGHDRQRPGCHRDVDRAGPAGYCKGPVYHGAIQFLTELSGHRMTGRWIGFGRDLEINDGPWTVIARLVRTQPNDGARTAASLAY